MKTEENKNPVNLKCLEEYVKSLLGGNTNHQSFLTPKEIVEEAEKQINKIKANKEIIGLDDEFEDVLLNKLRDYFKQKSINL